MSKKNLGRILIVAVTLVVSVYVAALWLVPVLTVTVHNVGESPMFDLQIHVTGNSYQLGDLQSGAATSCDVQAAGESDVEISYRLKDGSTKSHKLDCYIESGYRGHIDSEFVDGQLRSVTHEIRLSLL